MLYKLLWKWRGTIVITATIFIALSPFLFGYRIFFHVDFLTQHLPYFYFFNQSLARGDSVLWNPNVFSGFSGFASYNHVYMTPWSVILLYFVSPWTAYIGSVFFVLVLTGLLMAWFMRRVGVSKQGAVVGALTFVFSQWALIHDLPIVNTLYILPLLFFALIMFFQHKRKQALLMGSLGIGLGLASGHWQFMLEIFVAAGVFALYLRAKDNGSWRIPFAYAGMIAGGLLLSLPKLIPAVVYLQNSVRQGGIGHWEAARSGFIVFDFLRLLFPFDIASLGFAPEHYTYIGILAPLLAILVFSLRRGGYVKFFSWFFVGSLLLSVNNSIFYWALHHLPVFNISRYAERWGLLMFFALSVLVGFGIDMLKDNFEKIRNGIKIRFFRKLYAYAALTVSAIGIGATYILYRFLEPMLNALYFLFDRYGYPRTSGLLSSDYYHIYIRKNLLDILSNFDITKPRIFLALFFLCGAYFLLRLISRSETTAVFVTWALFFFIIANLVLVFPFMKRTATLRALAAEQPTATFLKNERRAKVFDFLTRKGGFEQIEFKWHDVQGTGLNDTLVRYYISMVYPNTGIFHELRSATLYDVVMARPMAKLLAYVGSERSEWREKRFTDFPISIEEKISLFTSRVSLLQFLGVTHVTTPYEIRNTAFEKVFDSGNVLVYRVSDVRPFYYFTDEERLLNLDNETSPAKLQEILETSAAAIHQTDIWLQNQKNTELRFRTKNPSTQLLVVSQNNLPGWRAWIDDTEAPIYTFGTVFQALRVPAGDHEIVLHYEYWEIWRYAFKSKLGINI